MRDSNAKVTVVVADDHPLMRDGVVRALSSSGYIQVVAEVDSGHGALDAIREHRPRVAVIDFKMPDLDGAQIAAAIVRDGHPTRVLLLSAHTESAIVYHGLENGAHGFLSKDAGRAQIVQAVLDIDAGRRVLAPGVAEGLIDQIQLRRDNPAPVLSAREREILGLIAQGKTVAAIADDLFLAVSTVKTHVQRLYVKLDVSDRGAAVAVAMRLRLLE